MLYAKQTDKPMFLLIISAFAALLGSISFFVPVFSRSIASEGIIATITSRSDALIPWASGFWLIAFGSLVAGFWTLMKSEAYNNKDRIWLQWIVSTATVLVLSVL